MFGSSNSFGQPSCRAFGAQPAFGLTNTANTNNPFAPTHFGSISPFGTQTGELLFNVTAIGVFPSIHRPSSTPAFGTSSMPFFGTSSVPAFGSTSIPAFGVSSTPAFGFSSTLFERAQSTIPTFGSYGFGQPPFGGQHGGSRAVPFTSTNEPDGGVGGQAPGKLISISAMPHYKEKSHEELRWKDYRSGDKGGPNPASQLPAAANFLSQPAQSSSFGQRTSTFRRMPSAFGQSSVANPFSSSSSSIYANKSSASPFGGAAFGHSFGSEFSTSFGASSLTSSFGTSSSPSLFASSTTSASGVAFSSSPFGVSSTPAFSSTPCSQASQPGLLFSSTPSLGSSTFGTRKPFGNTQSSGLFQSSTSTFGQSTPALVPIPAFGASSTPAFGASSSTPYFEFGSSSAFGLSSPAFGSCSTPAFGDHSSVFGAQSTIPTFGSYGFCETTFGGQHGGSRVVQYTSTNELDNGVGGQAPGKLISISAMPQYKEKSHEELRREDYQLGDKVGPNPASQQPAGASLFSQTAQSSPFGQTSTLWQTPSIFGQTSVANPFSSSSSSICANKSLPFGGAAFGTSFGSAFSTPFGASSSTSPFGTSSSPFPFASSTSSAFGMASSTSASAPLLGSSTFGRRKPFGNTQSSGPFQSSISTIGQSTPAYVSEPAFGASTASAFVASCNPAFGASCTSAFGGSITTPSFGFDSTSNFGRSTPAFGSRSTPAFGSTPSPFGDNSSVFGAQSTTPPFGITGLGHTPFWEQHVGSKSMPYTSTNEPDGGVGGQAPGKLISISAMSHYKEKSHEELRWEDYQLIDNHAFGSSMPTFGASSTTSPFGFDSISEDPDLGGVDAVSARLDKVMAEMDGLRLEVKALRVERDRSRNQLEEERGGGNGSFRDGVVVTVLERQLRQAQQDAQYYAGEASYYHGMLITHAPGAPVPPFSQLASGQSRSRPTMDPPHARREGSRGQEEQEESSSGSQRDHPQYVYLNGILCIVSDL